MIEPVHNIGHVYISKEGTEVDLSELNISKETLQRFKTTINTDVSLRYRFKQFLRAENDLGKAAKIVKHGLILFTPFGPAIDTLDDLVKNILINPKPTRKPMLSKILSIKNFINVYDENGNFSWQELGASLVQIIIAGGVVWGAQQLGIWGGLMELING